MTPSFVFSFRILRTLSTFISAQFNAAFSTLICTFFCFIRMRTITSFNESTAFIVPVLTTFLQLKYQGSDKNKTPFATHPTAMLVAVTSSVVYYLAYIALLRFPLRRFAVVAHYSVVWCGYASVASLASLLLPEPVSPVIYTVFVMLSAGELLYTLYHKLVEEEGAEFQAGSRRFRRFLSTIRRVVAESSGHRPLILPV